jgi:Xaa-Pro aminopeptidase
MNAQFTHGAGHSIGLDIHEAPYISFRAEHKFAEHTIMTIEPGLYFEGVGGVRIEDDVLVKSEDSCTLSKSPKRFACTAVLLKFNTT